MQIWLWDKRTNTHKEKVFNLYWLPCVIYVVKRHDTHGVWQICGKDPSLIYPPVSWFSTASFWTGAVQQRHSAFCLVFKRAELHVLTHLRGHHSEKKSCHLRSFEKVILKAESVYWPRAAETSILNSSSDWLTLEKLMHIWSKVLFCQGATLKISSCTTAVAQIA